MIDGRVLLGAGTVDSSQISTLVCRPNVVRGEPCELAREEGTCAMTWGLATGFDNAD